MKNKPVVIILVALLFAGAGFWAGMKYQQNKQPTFRQFLNGQGGRNAQFPNAANRVGFRPVAGEIIAYDGQSITVKLNDNSSKLVILSDKTAINKANQATKEDLKVGEKVAVFGQENPDGSITAQNIQLNPTLNHPAF